MQDLISQPSTHQATAIAMPSSPTAATTPPHVVEDCLGLVRVLSDGSIVRPSEPPPAPIHDDGTIEWKDVLFDPVHDLQLRLYRPRARLPSDPPKLPIFFYFHGGGLCLGSCTWPIFHSTGLRLASALRALIVSADYRLAPEHRLPAAIDDGPSALLWLRAQAAAPDPDPWLAVSADFERVFVSGESAGGSIVHHLALRFGPTELAPVRVRGFILLMPFFWGTKRTRSEAECPVDAFPNLEFMERCCRLALPVGADADHSLLNPFGPDSASLKAAQLEPMLVVVTDEDLLRDRNVEYVERLKGWGKAVELVEFAGQPHAFLTMTPCSSSEADLMQVIKKFMREN